MQEEARPVAAGREIGKRDLRVNRVDTLELIGKNVVVVPAVLLPFIGFVRVHPAVGQPVDAVAAGTRLVSTRFPSCVRLEKKKKKASSVATDWV